MRRLPIVILALVGAVALLTVLSYTVFSDAGGDDEPAQAAGPGELAAQPSEEPGDVEGAPTDPLASPDLAREDGEIQGSQEREAAATEEYDPSLTIHVLGEVRLAPGTPPDEQLEVLALKGRRASTLGSEEAPTLLLSGQTIDPDDVLARVPVDATGAFELELAPDVDEAYLSLHGRYLFTRDARRVSRSSEPLEVSLQTELGAWISGRLVLPSGAGPDEIDVGSLTLRLEPDRMGSFGAGGIGRTSVDERRTGLDSDLGWALGGVRAGASYDVRVRPEHFAAYKTPAFRPEPGQHVSFDLVLTRGAILAGTVVDENGAPIEEADLEVEIDPLMMGFGGFEVRDGETDAAGAFELAAVTPGKLILGASADGYLDAREDVEVVEGGAERGLRIELSRGNSIAGTVRWPDGTALAEAEVEAIFDISNMSGMGAFNAMSGPRGDDDTDAQGAFLVTGLGKGPFTVKVEAERDGREWRARVDAVAPGTEDLELVLSPPLDVAGRVVDELGEPVTAFSVRARSQTKGMIRGLGAEVVRHSFEDEQGRFLLEGLAVGNWELAASGDGFGEGEELEVALPRDEEAEDLVLVLTHAAVVSGTVFDPEGRTVAGATVQQAATLQGIVAQAGRDHMAEATTDAEGRFTLEGLTPGSFSVQAKAEGFARSAGTPVDVAPSQTLEGVEITLLRGGRIYGEIFNDDGSKKAGATIIAQSPADMTNQRFATSDSDGQFEFLNANPGSWQILNMPGGSELEGVDSENFGALFSEMKLQMCEVVDGEDVFVQLGAPPEDPVHVTGRVLLARAPQAGVMVSFILDGEAGGSPKFNFTTTDADGAYVLDLDQPGKYLVQVQKLVGMAGQQQSLQLNTEVPEKPDYTYDVDLPVGAITGTVHGPDGDPAASTRVTLSGDGAVSNLSFFGGSYAEIETDENGRYELVWLREGSFTVSAGGPVMGGMFGGGDSDTPGREVQNGVKVREGQVTEGVDFRLQRPGRLTGIVRDTAGKPVSGAAIFLRDDQGRLLERISLVATDGSGRFRYAGLAPGRFTVSARDAGRVSIDEVPVTIREGEESEIEATLDTGTMLKILLSDREGNPVDCSVTVSDGNGRQVNGTWTLAELMAISSGGAFSSKEQSVGPLPAGKYRVEATSSDGKTMTKNVTLSGQGERKLKLRLRG